VVQNHCAGNLFLDGAGAGGKQKKKGISMHNSQTTILSNPFPYDVIQAQEVFLRTITCVRDQQRSSNAINAMRSSVESDLNEQWAVLQELAYEGYLDRVAAQINAFMQEYARHTALKFLLRPDTVLQSIDVSSQGLQCAIREKLEGKHLQFTSELLLVFARGKQEREMTQEEATRRLVQAQLRTAERTVASQYEYNRDLLKQVLLVQDDARASLTIAMQGAHGVLASATDLVKSTHQHLQQALPSYVEEATVRAEKRKRKARWLWFGIAAVVIVGFPLLAFLLLQFL
jgi:hypothetical protein